MAFSGIIPTIQVSSNSIINTVVGGIVNNTVNGVVNVGLSTVFGQQVSRALGLTGEIATGNILSTIITPGLVNTGNQVLTNAISSAILRSNALGPAGPLFAGVTTQLFNRQSQSLLGAVAGLEPTTPQRFSESDIYFPGAGGEEDANYGGSVYNTRGSAGDIIFSIRPAKKTAKLQAQREAQGVEGVPPVQNESQSSSATGTSPQPPSRDSVLKGSGLSEFVEAISTGQQPSNPNLLGFTTPTALTGINYTFPTTPFPFSDSSQVALAYDAASKGVSLTGSPSFMKMAAAISARINSQSSSSTASVLAGGGPLKQDVKDLGWKFTTAPGSISWETSSKVERVSVFGTNRPPVVGGSGGMRDLSLSDALIEGFSFGKSVEAKIVALESLLNVTLTKSYVKVPVYWVTASDKKYGAGNGDGGFFVMKSVKVTEELRDLSGRTTRAKVDVSLMQVPDYQVDDGRDLASQTVSGGQSILNSVAAQVDKFQKEERTRAIRQAASAASSGGTARSGGQQGGCGAGKVSYRGTCVASSKTVVEGGVTRVLIFDPATGTYKR